jgi:hypothetical protein
MGSLKEGGACQEIIIEVCVAVIIFGARGGSGFRGVRNQVLIRLSYEQETRKVKSGLAVRL